MKKFRRHFAAVAALVFLLAFAPSQATAMEDDGHPYCFACHDCHPDLWCVGCGIYTLYAISGCCGNGGGTAFCMPEWGGFAVNCDSGANACQCNMTGEACDSLINN